MDKEYGAFLIKPDSVCLGYEGNLVRDIGSFGFRIEDITNVGNLSEEQIRSVWVS